MNNHEILAKEIEENFKSYFPNGYVRTNHSNRISEVIFVSIGLVGDIDWLTNNIRENDPMLHKFCVFVNSDGTYEAQNSMGALMIKPDPDSHLAMDRVKTPWRKTKGDAAKIKKAFDKFFSRLIKIIDDEKENIYGVEKIPAHFWKV